MRLEREIATFLNFYPGYKLADVLDEYALAFFKLLEEAYRLKYADYLWLAQVASVPYMEKGPRESFLRNLDMLSKERDDILKKDEDYSGIERLEKLLGG